MVFSLRYQKNISKKTVHISIPSTENGTPPISEDKQGLSRFGGGATRNRTRDTRIFSPVLYQLSYGTDAVKAMQI